MKLRKVFILLLVAIFLFATSCSNNEEKVVDDSSPVISSLIHGNPTGVWLMLSTGVSESVNKLYPGSIIEVTPGNNFSNLLRLEEHTSEFGLTHTTIAFEGLNGNGAFEKPLENVGGIVVFYPSMGQFIVTADKGISTFDDFIEQKLPLNLAVGAENQVAEVTFKRLLSEYGLTFEDLEAWGCKLYTKNHLESVEMVADDVLDAVWTVAGPPTPALMEIATNTDMIMLEFSDEIINKMVDNYGYGSHTLDAGSYDFQPQSIKSFSTFTMMAASLQTPEDTVYKVTKSIVENIDYIKSIHSTLKNLTVESMVSGMPLKLHPGAEKYLRETGWID